MIILLIIESFFLLLIHSSTLIVLYLHPFQQSSAHRHLMFALIIIYFSLIDNIQKTIKMRGRPQLTSQQIQDTPITDQLKQKNKPKSPSLEAKYKPQSKYQLQSTDAQQKYQIERFDSLQAITIPSHNTYNNPNNLHRNNSDNSYSPPVYQIVQQQPTNAVQSYKLIQQPQQQAPTLVSIQSQPQYISIPVVYNPRHNTNGRKQLPKVSPPKNYSSVHKQSSPPSAAIKRYCGNIRCKICKKLKLPIQPHSHQNINNSQMVEYLKLRKPAIPTLPSINRIRKLTKLPQQQQQQQQQLHLLFDNNNNNYYIKNRHRRVHSMADAYITNDTQPEYNNYRQPRQYQYQYQYQHQHQHQHQHKNRHILTEVDEHGPKYMKINGKIYEVLDQSNSNKYKYNISNINNNNTNNTNIVKPVVSQRKLILQPIPNYIHNYNNNNNSNIVKSREQLLYNYHQRSQKQRQELNKMVEEYINKYQTMYHYLQTHNVLVQENRFKLVMSGVGYSNSNSNGNGNGNGNSNNQWRLARKKNEKMEINNRSTDNNQQQQVLKQPEQQRNQNQQIMLTTIYRRKITNNPVDSPIQIPKQSNPRIRTSPSPQQEQVQVYTIKFPTILEIDNQISKYESLTGNSEIKSMLMSMKANKGDKNGNFIREYCEETGKEFLYFGGYDHQKLQRKGLGVLVTKKNILEGYWVKNFIEKGAELKQNSLYKGQFRFNKKHGEGTCTWLNGEEYTGQWQNGFRHGHGSWRNKDSFQTYSGQWRTGKVYGYGQYYKKGLSTYKGNFEDFVKNGQGVQQFENGDHYQGSFKSGIADGFGSYTWSNGLRYQGQFKKGKRQGKGCLKKDEVFVIEGEFQREKPHGICQLKLANRDIFNGKYIDGERYGYGKMFYHDRNAPEEGFWNHGFLKQKFSAPNIFQQE